MKNNKIKKSAGLLLILMFSFLIIGCSNSIISDVKDPQDLGNVGETEIVVLATDWDFSPSEINLKYGETTRIRVISKEGSHGLAVKELGIDTGLLQEGEEKVITVTPTLKGKFPLRCNVYCGEGHKEMVGKVIVE
jgi:cytochrome c oxidase subunit II